MEIIPQNKSIQDTQVIILAAGRGTRLYPLTQNCPKALLRFDDEPLLVRTVKQLQKAGFVLIRIIVGHMSPTIVRSLDIFKDSIQFIYNEQYATDTNSLSLYLGIHDVSTAALVIEADVVLSDACWPVIQRVCSQSNSTWFTCGKFQPHQLGGIIKSDDKQKIIDMKIVPKYSSPFSDYSKNLGILYIGQNELSYFSQILAEKTAESTAQYYMEHWITHLDRLSCFEVNLFPYPAGSFNTLEELEHCRQSITSKPLSES